jgi:hypothetical protein
MEAGRGAGTQHVLGARCIPLPLSQLRREVWGDRVSRVRQDSLTLAASVTCASWVSGSPSRLARVPPELDLMPVMWGYPQDFEEVRTELPYQL